jgi:hypothetical protein
MDRSNWTLRFNRNSRDIYGRALKKSDFIDEEARATFAAVVWFIVGLIVGTFVF